MELPTVLIILETKNERNRLSGMCYFYFQANKYTETSKTGISLITEASFAMLG